MEYRDLGKSGLKVSVVGLGCWPFGGEWGGVPQDDEDSVSTVLKAIDLGINFMDTAPQYGHGYSEEILGKILKKEARRKKVVLATKCGTRWRRNGAFFSAKTGWAYDVEFIWRDSSRNSILEEVERSLKRLQTDYIDLYQIHWPDFDTPIEETALVMKKLYEDGKIRAIGVSNCTVPLMEEFIRYSPLHSLQPPYNMVQRDIEADVLPYCIKNNIGVVVYSPLSRGLLTGKYFMGEKIPEVRKENPEYGGERYKTNKIMMERLNEIANKYKKTLGQLAINWTFSQPGITSAIVGARNGSQVEENVGGSGWTISEEDKIKINSILEERNEAVARIP